VPLWTNRYQGPSGPDQARSIVTDSSGNVLVSGVSTTTNGLPNYATVKYSNVGAALGTNRYTGITNSGALELGMAVDGSGNVFVVGYSPIVGVPPDYATVAYSSAGTPLWTNYYSEPVNGGAFPQAMAVDGAGNVIVTGGAAGGPSGPDYVTIKYSNAGVPLWTNRYNGPAASSSDIAYGVAVDSTSNIVVTGGSTASGSGVDIATIKYSSAGVPSWTNRYNGPGNANDQGNAVAVDANGNVFVTGYSIGLSGNQDFLTLAYSSAGAPLWTNRYHGPGGSNDRAVAIAVDASGNVVVTGLSNGANYDYATIKYSSAGVPLWTNRYNGPANNDDSVAATAVDSSGNVFVTGAAAIGVSGTGTFTNAYATVAYSSSGVPLWTNLYGPGSALAIALDSSGNVFVTGQGGVGNPGYATIKYSSSVAQGPSPIYLDFQSLNSQLVLSWTNPIFSLQTAPTLSDTFTNITGAASPYTNSITGNQQFFRLKSN